MPDDAIERARECLADVVGESAAWTAKNIRNNTDAGGALPVATADALRAMLAFAQQAPEGWRSIDTAPKDKGYQWIGRGGVSPFADFMRWDGERWVFSDGSYLSGKSYGDLFYHPLPAPPAMLDAAPSVTLGEVG